MREILIPEVPAQALVERIAVLRIVYDSNHIEVVTELGTVTDGVFTRTADGERTIINGDAYTEIMSESPAWAPNKPSGSFREDDVFVILDKIASGELKNTAE
tara:strand:+ start:3896 stop:4201 length:306 start_codon:yes stop_codon:yes gene_type:complete